MRNKRLASEYVTEILPKEIENISERMLAHWLTQAEIRGFEKARKLILEEVKKHDLGDADYIQTWIQDLDEELGRVPNEDDIPF